MDLDEEEEDIAAEAEQNEEEVEEEEEEVCNLVIIWRIELSSYVCREDNSHNYCFLFRSCLG